MIKNIVFDMGNVILSYNPNYILEQFTSDQEEIEKLKAEVFGSQEWQDLDQGLITKEEATNKMCKRVPETMHALVRKVMDEWYLHMPEIKEMNVLVKGLKEKGYRIYLLSNAPLAFYDFYQRVSAFRYFNGFYVSAKHRLLKPDPKIYEDFYKSFRLDEKQCLFIDDLLGNVEAAKSTGMDAIVFDGNMELLINQLKDKGIL